MDATLGGGGHSSEILKIIGKSGKLIAIDQDSEAIEEFKKRSLSEVDNLILVKGNFSNLQDILGGVQISAVSGILADLGYSSDQLEDVSRGMSFLGEAMLDMRLDREAEISASDIINRYGEKELGNIFKEYGEERYAHRIARKIIEQRELKTIETTLELVEIIKSAVPENYKHGRIHPATRSFQAIRIAVNRELESLQKFMPQAIEALKPGGRLAIISFHSLEDRIVKNIFRENARGCICPTDFPICQCGQKAKVKIITRKPIVPTDLEIAENPRSRSAKLRICEKM